MVVEIEYPNYWQSIASSSNKKYLVEEGSTEFSSISDRFLEGLPGAT